jgi:HEAT repeat protein
MSPRKNLTIAARFLGMRLGPGLSPGLSLGLGLAVSLALGTGQVAAAPPAAGFLPATTGWVSWEVPAIEGSPAWCCHGQSIASAPDTGRCDLENRSSGFISHNKARTDVIRVYAKLENGRIERLRTFAPSCEVEANIRIQPLGPRNAAESAAVLGKLLSGSAIAEDASHAQSGTPTRELYRSALASLALHRDATALDMLAQEARSTRPRELRKDAVFWMGQGRGEAGIAVLKPLMQQDADAEIRQHAAFSVSQSGSRQAAALLIQQGQTDPAPKVRSQAWFWLSQTGADDAEQAIMNAVQHDADSKVRHQALFALSQLPGERGVRALAAIAENRALDRDDRKRAVFWLGQSKSPEALAYLEKTLMRTAP